MSGPSLVTVAERAESETLPADVMVASLVSTIAAAAEMSALTIDRSAIFKESTEPSASFGVVTAPSSSSAVAMEDPSSETLAERRPSATVPEVRSEALVVTLLLSSAAQPQTVPFVLRI